MDQLLLETKLHEINNGLTHAPYPDHYSLIGGQSGLALFYAYQYHKSPTEALESKLSGVIEHCFDYINNAAADYSFGYGWAGFGWVMLEMHQLKIIDLNEDDLIDLNEFDEQIFQSIQNDAKLKNYDFFSGIVGKGIYFIKRYELTKDKYYLQQIVSIVLEMSVTQNEHRYWRDYGDGQFENNSENINLGLAHGMPSILVFLLKIYNLGIEQTSIAKAVTEAIDWILAKLISVDDRLHTPYYVDLQQNAYGPAKIPGRLGWCYGDIGMANALLFAGKTLHRDDYYKVGLDMALFASQRKDRQECSIVDASVCHGTAGLSLIFNALFHYTDRADFATAAEYWQEQTFSICNRPAALVGGYQYWNGEQPGDDKYTDVIGLFQGVTGVGLSLIDGIYNDPDFDWKSLLLMCKS